MWLPHLFKLNEQQKTRTLMTLGFMREFLFKCNSYACKWTWNLTRVMEKQVGTTKMLGKVSIVIIETCFNREADEGGQHKQEQQLNS